MSVRLNQLSVPKSTGAYGQSYIILVALSMLYEGKKEDFHQPLNRMKDYDEDLYKSQAIIFRVK